MIKSNYAPVIVRHPVTNKLFDVSALFSEDVNLMPDNDFLIVGENLDNAIRFVSMNSFLNVDSDMREFQNVISILFDLRDVFNQMKEVKPVSE